MVVGVVAKPPFPLSPAKTGRDIGDEDRASAMFVDAGDRCRPTIAPPPAVWGAQATLRCGRKWTVRTKGPQACQKHCKAWQPAKHGFTA